MDSPPEHMTVRGVKVSVTNLKAACEIIDSWIRSQNKAYVCVIPVSTIVECQDDKEYMEIVNHADMATPDGMPLVWLGKLKGYKDISRTYGPDLMLAVCEMSQKMRYTHYFLGSTPEVCRLLEVKLKERFPRLSIVGKYSPPFGEWSLEEDEKIVEEINRVHPDILWVGLGSPKQDYWMYRHRDNIDTSVMLGVGAAFDFIAGTKKQAPRWMQKAGLEWFFRLCCEPKRLWRRYLIGNPKFIYYLLTDTLKQTFHKSSP